MARAIPAEPVKKTALTPTGILMAEHRNIERMLACLEVMAGEFEVQEAMDPALAGDALEFLRTYADRLHHGKEEANLFPAMEARGVPADAGPTAVMREEHRMGRGLIRDMGDAVGKGSVEGFVGAAREYVMLLRDHIAKEDQVLFPLADGILLPAEQEGLLAAFARVEGADIGPETLGRMLAICGRLTARYGITDVPRPAPGAACGGCCGH